MLSIVLLALFIQTALTSYAVDDFPVLEHLGCKECPRAYVPVCGTDKKTYVNACRLNCANSKKKKDQWVYIDRYGPCVEYGAIFEAKGMGAE